MNALVFLYKKVLKQPLDGKIDAVRAKNKRNVPVVMTREEVSKTISLMKGTPQLVVKLLYGNGLRIYEAIRMRVQDIDYNLKQRQVRPGKGDKDRITTFPVSIVPLLKKMSGDVCSESAEMRVVKGFSLAGKVCFGADSGDFQRWCDGSDPCARES